MKLDVRTNVLSFMSNYLKVGYTPTHFSKVLWQIVQEVIFMLITRFRKLLDRKVDEDVYCKF